MKMFFSILLISCFSFFVESADNQHVFVKNNDGENPLSAEDLNRIKSAQIVRLKGAFKGENTPSGQEFLNNYLIVSTLTFSQNVTKIELRSCGLTDSHLQQFDQFINLLDLALPTNNVSSEGLTRICQATNLEKLDLSNNDISNQSLDLLTALKNLEDLNLSLNEDIRGSSLVKLTSLPISKLNISHTGITQKDYDDHDFPNNLTVTFMPASN